MKDELVLNNIELIYFVLKKMKLFNKKDDYYDAGLIGLIKAANYYNPEKGFKFSSLAVRCIQNEIMMVIRSENRFSNNNKLVSLNTPILDNGKDEITLIDILSSDLNIEDDLLEKDLIETLVKAVMRLTKEEQQILKLYYGEELSQIEVAEKMNIAQPTVARKLKKIIKKLRNIMGDILYEQ